MVQAHPPTTPKRRQTRERLMDAAYDLFANEGVHATSIEAIAEAAGFTRGAFYSNFESKDELFIALAHREWNLRLTLLREAITRAAQETTVEDLSEQIPALLIEILNPLPDDRKWALIYREYELLAMRDPDIAKQYLHLEEEFRSQRTEVLSFAAERFGATLTLEPTDVMDLLSLLHENAVRAAILSGVPDASRAIRDELLRTIPPLLQVFTTQR